MNHGISMQCDVSLTNEQPTNVRSKNVQNVALTLPPPMTTSRSSGSQQSESGCPDSGSGGAVRVAGLEVTNTYIQHSFNELNLFGQLGTPYFHQMQMFINDQGVNSCNHFRMNGCCDHLLKV
jgi:hypothetical protein